MDWDITEQSLYTVYVWTEWQNLAIFQRQFMCLCVYQGLELQELFMFGCCRLFYSSAWLGEKPYSSSSWDLQVLLF